MDQIINELQQLQHHAGQIAQDCQSLQNRLQMVTGDVEQEERRRQFQSSQGTFGQAGRGYGTQATGNTMAAASSYGSQYQTGSHQQPGSQVGAQTQASQYRGTGVQVQSSQYRGSGTQAMGSAQYQPSGYQPSQGQGAISQYQPSQYRNSTAASPAGFNTGRGQSSAVNQNSIQAVLQADANYNSQSATNGRQSEQPSYRRSF